MLVYGIGFAALTAVGFALMGVFATALSQCLRQRPRLVNGLNVGAGLTFVASVNHQGQGLIACVSGLVPRSRGGVTAVQVSSLGPEGRTGRLT